MSLTHSQTHRILYILVQRIIIKEAIEY